MKQVLTFVQLSAESRRTLLWALFLVPVTRLNLKVFGLRRTQTMLASLFPLHLREAEGCADLRLGADSTGRLVRAAALHGICNATCLPLSLATWALLRRSGLDASFRIGVRFDDGQLRAHAWVESGGVVVDGVITGDPLNCGFSPFMGLR